MSDVDSTEREPFIKELVHNVFWIVAMLCALIVGVVILFVVLLLPLVIGVYVFEIPILVSKRLPYTTLIMMGAQLLWMAIAIGVMVTVDERQER